ncbi:MAG: DUF1697 domain-containing protein [Anaerolineaceae bacterium]|nr:MAG: DUF1697 domain-containing protein [Anaerolineaceae bacterium]
MKKYIAFLRAINVGGTKIIKMDNLKKIFESFGFANVQTYIQSGNVVFETKESAMLEAKIEEQLEQALGYKVEVFLRTMDELAKIASQPAFEPRGDETLHVVFLRKSQDANHKSKQELLSFRSEADDFAVKGREVYNLRRDRDKSVFSNNFIEKSLKESNTTRNLTTLRKITEKYG